MLKKMFYALSAFAFCVTLNAQDNLWPDYNANAQKNALAGSLKKYITYDTTGTLDSSTKVPSTKLQENFLKMLQKELIGMGYENVRVERDGSLQLSIPSNSLKTTLTLGFIAHIDSMALVVDAKNIKVQEIQNYAGGDIIIDKGENTIINPETMPELQKLIGQDLILSANGKPFGADPKAGISILMNFAKYLSQNPQIEHGAIKIAFIPDAFSQKGSKKFDIKKFGADFAYVIDGNYSGEIIDETFYGRSFKATFTGYRTVALGDAATNPDFTDNTMMSVDFRASLPRDKRPETTTGRQGYIFPLTITDKGNVSEVYGLIRSFDAAELEAFTNIVKLSADDIKQQYPGGAVSVEIKQEYANMKDSLPFYVLDLAQRSMKEENIEPFLTAARGSSEGATFSLSGLPAPILFTGAQNINTFREIVSVDTMEQALRTLVRIANNTTKLSLDDLNKKPESDEQQPVTPQ